ncbi:MAG: nuclear transport factor 2 family protein [Phycicoccus sp.]
MTTGSGGMASGAEHSANLLRLREQLVVVVTSLWFDVDHHHGRGAHRYFTADARLRFDRATVQGSAAIARVYADRSARGPRLSRHLSSNLHLVQVDPTRVRAISGLLLFAEDGVAPRLSTAPTLVADVHDEFELHDGRWLIDSRWVENLFIAPTTELAVPQRPMSRAGSSPGPLSRRASSSRGDRP